MSFNPNRGTVSFKGPDKEKPGNIMWEINCNKCGRFPKSLPKSNGTPVNCPKCDEPLSAADEYARRLTLK